MTNTFAKRVIQASPDCPLLALSAQLMTNFREVEPIAGASEVRAVRTVAGDVAVFSTTSSGDVVYVFPDPTQESGWNVEATGLTASNGVRAVLGPDGVPAAFATNGTNSVTRAYRQNNGSTTQWVQDQLAIPGVESSETVSAVTAAAPLPKGSDGNWFLSMLFNGGCVSSTQYLSGTAPLGTNFGFGAAVIGGPVLSASWAGGTLYNVWFSNQIETDVVVLQSASEPSSQTQIDAPGTKVSALSSASNPSGSLPFVALLREGTAYVLNPVTQSWQELKRPPGESNGIRLNTVQIVAREDGLHLLVLGDDKRIYHASSPDGSVANWTTFSPIAGDVRAFSAALDSQSNLQVFVAAGQALRLLSLRGKEQDFTTTEVGFGGKKPLVEVMTYNTEITVLDDKNNPQPNKKVWVWASGPVLATVNGATELIDQDTRAETTSNLMGKVVIGVDTKGLSTAVLKVRSDLMSEDDACEIEPNSSIQETLANIDAEGLRGATDQLTNAPIFPADTDFDNLCSTVNELATLSVPVVPGGGGGQKSRPRRCPRARMSRADREFHTGIDLSSAAAGPWMIEFLPTANVRFERLTPQRLRAIRRQESIFSKIKAAWSEFWGWARDKTVRVLSAVYEAGKVTIQFLANGVKLLFEAEIKVVEQVFDVLEEVFRKVKATIEKVFSWLAVLFNWSDILMVQDVVEHGVDAMLELAEKGVNDVGTAANQAIADLVEQMKDAVARLKKRTSDDTIGSLQDKDTDGLTMGDVTDHNIALNNIVNMPPSGSSPFPSPPAAPSATLTSAWKAFTFGVEKALKEEKIKEDLKSLGDALNAIATRPNDLASQGAAVFLDLADVALDLVGAVLRGSLDGLVALIGGGLIGTFRSVIDAEIEIPILTALYKRVTRGRALSVKSVVALVVSLVATPLYKLASGELESPFSGDFVESFKAEFTPGAILSELGFMPVAGPGLRLPSAVGKVGSILTLISGVTTGVLSYFIDLMIGGLSWLKKLLETVGTVLPGSIAAVAGVITAAFSAPFLRGERLAFQTAANRLWFIEVMFLHMANVVTAGITYEDSDPEARTVKVIRGLTDPFADLYLLAVGFGLWIGNVVLIEQGCTTEPRMSVYQAIQRGLAPLPVFFAWSRRLFDVAPVGTALFLGVVDLLVPAVAGAFGVVNAFAPKSADGAPPPASPASLMPALSA